MKNPIKPYMIPYCTLVAGILGLILQVVFFATGVDHKALLVSSHPADILSWILTAFVLAALALGIQSLGGVPKYETLFPSSAACALGTFAGAVGVAIAGVQVLLAMDQMFSLITGVVGLIAALCLVAHGYWRWKGQKHTMLTHIPVIIFFMLHLICQYRTWSTATQLQEYAFPLLASVFLMLSCYQRAALESNMTGRKSYVFFSQAAAFFSLLAIPANPLYYLPMALWAFWDICSLRVMSRRPKKADTPQEE